MSRSARTRPRGQRRTKVAQSGAPVAAPSPWSATTGLGALPADDAHASGASARPDRIQAALGRDPLAVAGIGIGVLVVLLALRPAVQGVVGASVRSVANVLVGDTTFGSGAHVSFTPAAPGDKPPNRSEPVWDTFAWITNDLNGAKGRRLLSSTRAFYTPDCAYLAPTLALPFRKWTRRKAIAMALGFVALQATLFAGLLLALVEDMGEPSSPIKVYDFGGFTLDVITAAVGSLEHRLGAPYLLALIFWLVAIFAGTRPSRMALPE